MAVAESPGNFSIVVGDKDVKRRLLGARGGIDDWLYGLVDDVSFQAAERLRLHAPGNIRLLVDSELAHEQRPGAFEASSGVTPDPRNTRPLSRRGSDPADYPYYADQGTGVYGEKGSPIYAFPGTLMGPINYRGRDIYVHSIQGQPAQHYSDAAFVDTVAWTPAQIELAMPELRRRLYGL